MENGEWRMGMGNGEWRMANEEWEWGIGNGTWRMGNGELNNELSYFYKLFHGECILEQFSIAKCRP